jgi:hypothetical protein
MLWPSPISVRMSVALQTQLFRIAEECQTLEQVEIDDFPKHGKTLNDAQITKLNRVVDQIIAPSPMPVAAVQIVGHADVDLSVPAGPQRKEMEQTVSDQRAVNASMTLIAALKMRRGGSRLAAMLKPNVVGKGATQLKFKNPVTEFERRRNRRVVIQVMRCALPNPPPPIPPDHPHDPPNPDDNPNVVMAGNQFKIKILKGGSAGVPASAVSITLAIWDFKNSRLAKYEFKGTAAGASLGLPFSKTGETDWSPNLITTSKAVTVEQFAGRVEFVEAVAPDPSRPLPLPGLPGPKREDGVTGSRMLLELRSLEAGHHRVTIDTGGSSTSIVGVETGNGDMNFVSGSTIVYKGGAIP